MSARPKAERPRPLGPSHHPARPQRPLGRVERLVAQPRRPQVLDRRVEVVGDPPQFDSAVFDHGVGGPRVAVARLADATGIEQRAMRLELEAQVVAAVDEDHPVGLYHASPRDPVWEYVLSTGQAGACMDTMTPRIGAIGHSHVALWFKRNGDGGGVAGDTAPGGTELDLSKGDWLINPGAVGQPRDGDPRAAWLLLDTGAWSAEWRRVEYPIDEAASAIEDAGLPMVLAQRLYTGQ